MFRKLLVLLTLGSVTLLGLAAFAPAASATAEAHKWYVCKFVGPPGSGEVLQTGNNPIFVDENAIDTSPVFIGAAFGDAQTHSLVVAGPFISAVEPEPTCPGQTPPPGVASATLSAPTCLDLFIRATGSNLTDSLVTFDVFINGTLIDAFELGAGQQATGPGLAVKNGDVITVKLLGGEVTLATRTIDLDCTTPPPPGGGSGGGGTAAACPGKIAVGSWYGDPRINITLTGVGVFVVSGGVQRFTGLRTITKTLACNETLRIGRYKVNHGHYLSISLNGVLVTHIKPPRV